MTDCGVYVIAAARIFARSPATHSSPGILPQVIDADSLRHHLHGTLLASSAASPDERTWALNTRLGNDAYQQAQQITRQRECVLADVVNFRADLAAASARGAAASGMLGNNRRLRDIVSGESRQLSMNIFSLGVSLAGVQSLQVSHRHVLESAERHGANANEARDRYAESVRLAAIHRHLAGPLDATALDNSLAGDGVPIDLASKATDAARAALGTLLSTLPPAPAGNPVDSMPQVRDAHTLAHETYCQCVVHILLLCWTW
ncbi:hypothetical protein ColTof4_14389 [Colletotrichum tofieldiae]|nr:hypothetical protein ColTof3_14803 [Colletotrichum tofieldiae]GKT81966.1 hypothetical protein ColTof4_14389 [Colletotrichum tofieldiae]